MSKTVRVTYNADTLQTEITIDGQFFDTSRINGRPIDEWVYPFIVKKTRWNGIFQELASVVGTDSYTIRFSGKTDSMFELMEECPENVQILKDKNSKNETTNTTAQIPTVQSSEDLLQEIERILDEAFDDFENRQKKTKEFEWIMGLAKLGNTRAQYVLSEFYAAGIGTERNDEKSFEWAKTAAENGDPNAQCNLGDMYFYGDCSLKEDMNEAFYWYDKAANQECASAYGALGRCYLSGLGVEEDLSKAFKYLSLGYSNDELEARDKYNLACCFYEGLGTEKNYEKAFELFESISSWIEGAQNFLGLMYYYGDGVKQNYNTAAQYFEQAVDNGYEDALGNLAYCYYKGYGVKQNHQEALRLYQQAAKHDKSDVSILIMIGYIYYLGQATGSPAYEKALYYFKKALKLEPYNETAQYMQGLCYINENDTDRGMEYIESASENGCDAAKSFLNNKDLMKKVYNSVDGILNLAGMVPIPEVQTIVGIVRTAKGITDNFISD